MASHENRKLARMGQEVITHLSYLMLLALKTAEYITDLRGQCKDISDLSLPLETLDSFLFPPQIFFFLWGRPPWTYFSLLFSFTQFYEVKPSESSITAVWKEKMSCNYPTSFSWCLGEHLPLFTHTEIPEPEGKDVSR